MCDLSTHPASHGARRERLDCTRCFGNTFVTDPSPGPSTDRRHPRNVAMSADSSDEQHSSFKETSWTIVLNAADGSVDKAGRALASLCESYWPAIYGYIRQHGRDEHDAQDLTQAFFEHLISSDTLGRARREKGRFRS